MALSGDGGKGYGRRPQLVSNDKAQSNWDRIFKSKTEQIHDRQNAVEEDLGIDPLTVYNEERLVSKYDKENLKGKE
jgi:hypothetical protein